MSFAAMCKPAEQHQGEPVAWLYSRPDGQVEPVVTLNKASASDRGSWDEAPLYTLADLGEVERLRAQLAERDALLREVAELDPRGEFLGWHLDGRIDAALSASAEPSAQCCGSCPAGCVIKAAELGATISTKAPSDWDDADTYGPS